MPCVSLLQKAICQLSCNKIVEGALTYLKATEDLLFFSQHRRKDISEDDYKFRTDKIKYFKSTIKQLNFKVKSLQDEINKLKKENKDLYKEMNNLSRNFGLIHLDENKEVLLGRKKQEIIDALHGIRKILDLYKNKYKSDMIEADPLKIVEIIEDEHLDIETKSILEIQEMDMIEADPSTKSTLEIQEIDMVKADPSTKSIFVKLEIQEMLAEIANNLSP
ncbi:35340_t:CDS:2, partial [Racocetra persica]